MIYFYMNDQNLSLSLVLSIYYFTIYGFNL